MFEKLYESWLNDPVIDDHTKAELRAITDKKEIEDRFYTDLEFGTAGLRGVIGAGRNRMNIYIVSRATQGLADYLNAKGCENGVVIAYDSRHKSDEFAMAAALVLCANGIKTSLFKTIHSVPQLSFTLRYLQMDAGIVITASHNPKQYNGYKVFGADGGQIGPDQARKITKCIQAVEDFSKIKSMYMQDALKQGLLTLIGEKEDEAYYSAVKGLSLEPGIVGKAKDFSLVYTPLYGCGNVPVTRMLKEIGVEKLYIVKEQQNPDPDFPTVSAPNPESPDAFDLAKKLAEEKHSDLLIATDPDSDRLGVAVRGKDGEFVTLSGNQIGCLLLHYILDRKKANGALSEKGLVVKSIVSTGMANVIASDFSVEICEVLTGFRYIGIKIDECEKLGERDYLFGFEESFGYNAGPFVRDKDAISSAMLLAECAAFYSIKGMTLLDALEQLFKKYGYFDECVVSHTLYGIDGMERMAAAMEHLRKNVPTRFDDQEVIAVRDYSRRMRTDMRTGEQEPIVMPVSDVLYYELKNGAWVCIRPSGTEPKLKAYANGYAASKAEAKKMLQALIDDCENKLKMFLK